MAMTFDSDRGELSSEINVTPLIDVLLVLLIIFMVIVPMVPKGLEALVPQPPTHRAAETGEAIVVSVLHGQRSQMQYRINEDVIPKSDLSSRLTAIYANRAERVLFVKGDDDVNFAKVAEVIDMAHSVGVDHVGLITPKISQGL